MESYFYKKINCLKALFGLLIIILVIPPVGRISLFSSLSRALQAETQAFEKSLSKRVLGTSVPREQISSYPFDGKIKMPSAQNQLTGDWYDASWLCRAEIIIDNTANSDTLSNYQVKVIVNYDFDMQGDFDDIRFTDFDGTTLIDHWLETKVDFTQATFWVEVPTIPALSSKRIYMYYGNPDVSSASNGYNTFMFFDDFEACDVRVCKSASNPLFYGVEPSVIREGLKYWIYYDDGTSIYRRVSSDGINWGPATQVLADGVYCDVYKNGSTYRMVYIKNVLQQVRLATSSDGVKFTDQGVLVETGLGREWDDYMVIDPCEIKVGSTYYLFYGGGNFSTDKYAIGLAASTTGLPGSYIKYINNPILSRTGSGFESKNVFDADVFEYDTGKYIMFYTGNDGSKHMASYATSTDLVNWSRAGRPLYGKSQPYEQSAEYGPNEPTVLIEDGVFKVWYRGNPDLWGSPNIGFLTIAQDSSTKEPEGYWQWLDSGRPRIYVEDGLMKLSDSEAASYTYSDSYQMINGTIEAKMKYVRNSNLNLTGRIDAENSLSYGVGGANTNTSLHLVKHDSGFVSLGSVPFTHGFDFNVYKLELSGASLKAKAWSYGSSEPQTWMIEAIDGSLSVGSVGFYVSDSEAWIDWVRVRTFSDVEPVIFVDWLDHITLELIKPAEGEFILGQGSNVRIEWLGRGPVGSSVSLRRDDDNIWNNNSSGEKWIAFNQPVSGTYQWNTSDVSPGTYYIAAMITNNGSAVHDYAPGVLTIEEIFQVADPGTVSASHDITIYADIFLPDSASGVVFYYKQCGKTAFESTSMTLRSGDLTNGKWSAFIPAEKVNIRGLLYYIEATGVNGGKYNYGSQFEPMLIPVYGVDVFDISTTLPGSSNVWNIVAPGVIPENNSVNDTFQPFGAFAQIWTAWYWNPTARRWEVPQPLDNYALASEPFDVGISWWFVLDSNSSPVTFSVAGTSVDGTKPYTITLKVGWNSIANPFDYPVAWSDSIIKVRYSGQEMTPTQSESLEWVDNRAIWYDASQGGYVMRYSYETDPYIMPPNCGQWLYSMLDGAELLVPPIEATFSSSLSSPSSAELSTLRGDIAIWKVVLSLSSGSGSDRIEAAVGDLGIKSGSIHHLKPPAYPVPGPRIFFTRLIKDGRKEEFFYDVQPKLEQMIWSPIEATTTSDASLEWKLINVPYNYYIYLRNTGTGEMVDLKQQRGITIEAKEGVYHFVLTASRVSEDNTPRSIPLNPGWNLVSLNVDKCFYQGEPPTDQPECVELISVSDLGYTTLAEWFDSVLTADNPVSNLWLNVVGAKGAMDRTLPGVFHTLKYMSPCDGYWMFISDESAGVKLAVEGAFYDPNCGISLHEGWNLVGYPLGVGYYDTDTTPSVPVPEGTSWVKVSVPVVDYVFGSISGKYSIIVGSEGAADPSLPAVFSSLRYIAPGRAYWVKMNEAAQLVYPAFTDM